ncbi:hypothetical protein [Streptomyces sp. H51]|uniref:hypothetical protein n=1 Tax=Streptomyces sp. H51 TaxID=3111770 RepID=UPI002D76F0DC|nr:hypothetical protein [Streptomyces sp. H51]
MTGDTLAAVLDAEISPELVPGEETQSTASKNGAVPGSHAVASGASPVRPSAIDRAHSCRSAFSISAETLPAGGEVKGSSGSDGKDLQEVGEEPLAEDRSKALLIVGQRQTEKLLGLTPGHVRLTRLPIGDFHRSIGPHAEPP